MPEAELSLLFVRPLNQAGLRYVVSGGVAAMLYGEPRFTNDVDMLIFLPPEDIHRLQQAFPSPEYSVPPAEVLIAEIAHGQQGQFNVVHSGSGFKADFYLAGRDELNAWAFRHARKMDYKGEPVVVAPPECVIVRKLEFYREGGSDKHLRDIRTILAVSGEQIDRSALAEWIHRQGVEAQWKLVEA
jgi:hypothetical protein